MKYVHKNFETDVLLLDKTQFTALDRELIINLSKVYEEYF